MNYFRLSTLLFALCLLWACEERSAPEDGNAGPTTPAYVVMDDSLRQLKEDFNSNAGRVRLLFLVGPTCGICLRGMADLNDEFLAASQNDDRLQTFVVHVPTLGARERHVADTIPLLDGPRVTHYWEDSGIVGQHYQDVLDIRFYAWDIWMIYGPDVKWEGTLPPVPDFWQHQLPLDRDKILNPETFAVETRKHLDRVDAGVSIVSTQESEAELLADGTVIPMVAQPRGVAIQQHIMRRGGYQNLKRIQKIKKSGRIEFEDASHDFKIVTSRPSNIERIVAIDDKRSVGQFDGETVTYSNPSDERGLPRELETVLLSSFEFDGPFIEWPDKGHDITMTGMEKHGDVLAWKLDMVQKNGPHWILLVDSHGGGIVKATLLGDNDEPQLTIFQSDYRETSQFMFPHRIEYRAPSGETIATEYIDSIAVDAAEFKIDNQTVVH